MISPHLVEPTQEKHLAASLDAAGLRGARPVLVVVGGAAGLTGGAEVAARQVIEQVVMPVAVRSGAAMVDGGTDVGVMRLVGKAHAEAGARTPLVGVAVHRLIRVPGDGRTIDSDAAGAEPHHTHLVLVPGRAWGDESPWLSAVATHLSGGRGAVTLVMNGGPIALSDVRHSVSAGRPVLVAEGTGRVADLLTGAIRGDASVMTENGDVSLRALVGSGLISVLRTDDPTIAQQEQLSLLLRQG